jgi:hypothetical protein
MNKEIIAKKPRHRVNIFHATSYGMVPTDHMKLANEGAKRMLTSTRPNQTARTILKHLLAYVRRGG